MAADLQNCLSCILLLSSLFATLSNPLWALQERNVYIVYMGDLPKGVGYMATFHHQTILQRVLRGSSVSDSLVRNYHRSFNGFAAKLTEEESREIASMESVVSVFRSKTYELHTTRSWDFMSFTSAVKRMPEVESDIIVGVLDSGVWPESKSFHDEGFGPPPKKWKGICQTANNFSCNNKLIGGRAYDGEGSDISPRDIVGHGTHTSSIIVGREVEGVSLFNLAKGTARGALPYARLATYQVCSLGCSTVNILAGFDDAIADGVDIISVSLGGISAFPYEEDVVSIGGFHAMKKGILTSQSAGNSGPEPSTVQSVAPWVLSVAASNIDRWINNKISLGDGTTFLGSAINTFGSEEQEFPLIHGKQAESYCGPEDAGFCRIGCLDEKLVKGKIVFCAKYSKGIGALVAGAVGTIMEDGIYNDCPFSYPLPATLLTSKTGGKVDNYINNTKNPKASILRSEDSLKSKAPVVVSFSSRGPNSITQDILKAWEDLPCLKRRHHPDISAPGVAILAAYSPIAPLSHVEEDKRFVKYNIVSGTSMSCPHATGAAAYIKSFHPDWSASAIKSALMTTAFTMNSTNNPEAEFAYGAGHINPVKAVDPGLVYEAYDKDYIEMLCNIGYSTRQVRIISGDNSSCSDSSAGTVRDLNYPSMAFKVKEQDVAFASNFSRTVTNVGSATSTYKASISPSDSEVMVTVTPSVLKFKSLKEKKSFVVTVSGKKLQKSIVSLSLVWSDGAYNVRSPVVVYM